MTASNLKKEILKSRAPMHWQNLIQEVINNPLLLRSLISFAFCTDKVLSFRASWIMDKSAEKCPGIVSDGDIESIAIQVVTHTDYSVIRSALRLLSRVKFPVRHLGLLVDQCFSWLTGSAPIAVKVHAMQILYNITKTAPDLKNELTIVIEEQLPYGSAGFKSRGKRILKLLKKK